MPNHFGSLGWLAHRAEAAQGVEATQCFATSKGKVDLGRPPKSLSFPRWILVPGWHCGGQEGNGQLTHILAWLEFLSSVFSELELSVLCFFSLCPHSQGWAFEQERTGVSAPLLPGSVTWVNGISTWSLGFLTCAGLLPQPLLGFVLNPGAQEGLHLSLCPCSHPCCR